MNKIISKVLGNKYEDLWKYVIRPEKDDYTLDELGPVKFKHNQKLFKQTDLTLTNKRNLKLCCSFWEPEERKYPKLPCVIYLHGNSSSRTEIFPELYYLLSSDITVFAFDFSGCGKSQGEYISLGYYEREDVESVIEYLRKTNKVSTIGLWGRSMGAVTAIMYGDRDPSIAGMVLDSAFASLKELIEELVKDRVKLPDFILNQATKLVKSTINKKAKFNLDEIEPKKYAVRCFIPALFCHANGDTFVNVHHCKDLYDIYAGDKNVTYVDGNHNSPRPRYFRDSAAIFFYNTLQCERMKEISDDYNGFKHVVNENEDIKENENKEEEEKIINNNNNDFNFPEFNNFNNENEEYMLQQILELSLKEYESQNKKADDNKNINDKNSNLNNNINNININYNPSKNENDIQINPPQNNIINNNMSISENNNIINDNNNIINNNNVEGFNLINEPNQNNIINNNVINNPNKGLFNDLNPVPLQNHEKNGN